jgi:predicted homoserine dehydrogenase-like protein
VKNNNVPIGLVGGSSVAKRDIKDGTFLTYDDIEIDETTTVYRLRKLQDSTFGD